MKKTPPRKKEKTELIRVRSRIKEEVVRATERSGLSLVEEASRAIERGLANAVAQN